MQEHDVSPAQLARPDVTLLLCPPKEEHLCLDHREVLK